MECPRCGYAMEAFDRECPRCANLQQQGEKAQKATVSCPRCNNMNPPGQATCWHCNYQLLPAPAAPASPTTGGIPYASTPPPGAPTWAYGYPMVAPPMARRNIAANTWAIWSLVLGIVGMLPYLWLCAPFAIWTGHTARKLDPNVSGMAVAGFVLGIVGSSILALMTLGFIVFYMVHAS